MSEDSPPKKNVFTARPTIKTLRLDPEAAKEGRTWRLLPEGFRALECGKTYPLPSRRAELQELALIVVPPGQRNAGVTYLNRVIKKWRQLQSHRASALTDIASKRDKIERSEKDFSKRMEVLEEQAKQAVNAVHEEAQQASASLRDLFALGRKGLDGQMKAHLAGETWQEEKINAKAFRDCYAMVSNTVKALGIPSGQKQSANDAIVQELAEALRATQDGLKYAPGKDDTEH